jgi:Myb-like DNA-binding domain
VAPIRYQKKRPGRRCCRRRSVSGLTPPSCASNDEKTTVISGVDPDCLELPIHGSLGIRIVGSETFYALNFRQDLSRQRPSPGRRPCTEVRRGSARSPRAGKSGPTPRPLGKRSKFTPEEDESLVELKGRRGLSWEEINTQFPKRSMGTLQVRYSTKLKARAGKRRGRG